MNLVRAELERLAARRFVQLMVVLLVLAFGVTAATTLAGSHKPTAVELSDARNQAAEARQSMEDTFQRCLARKNGTIPSSDGEEYSPRTARRSTRPGRTGCRLPPTSFPECSVSPSRPARCCTSSSRSCCCSDSWSAPPSSARI